jgi:hypothetical protein
MQNLGNNKFSVTEFNGEGLTRAVESGEWFVGIKNYKPANDVDTLEVLEKHLKTDEVFVLLSGICTLLIDKSEAGDCKDVICVPMDQNKVYCINKNVYHTTIVSKDVKMILIENKDTSAENSEFITLCDEHIAFLKKEIKENYIK